MSRNGRSRTTDNATNCSAPSGRTDGDTATSAGAGSISRRSISSPPAIPASAAASLSDEPPKARGKRRTSQATFWPSRTACGRDGFSAKTCCHRMWSTSLPGWTRSDTARALSIWTVRILRPAIAGGSSLSRVLTIPYTGDLKGLSLSMKTLGGMVRRVRKIDRSFCRVFWRPMAASNLARIRVTCGNKKGEFCASSPPRRGSGHSDSRLAGLLDLLRRAEGQCSATASTSHASGRSETE